MKERLNCDVDQLLQYRPSFAPVDKTGALTKSFSDHGLASGGLFAQMYHGWTNRLHNPVDRPHEHPGLSELLNLRGAEEASWMGVNPPHRCAAEMLYTILVHNLYPKDLLKLGVRNFRTKRDREPFTYLALLCDSLQPWDRKRLYNHATGRIHYTVYAEHFNLTVLNNVIRVHEEGDDLLLDQRLQELRVYLDEYLEGVAQIIRLRLAEYKSGM